MNESINQSMNGFLNGADGFQLRVLIGALLDAAAVGDGHRR